jgi:hypothetical protein
LKGSWSIERDEDEMSFWLVGKDSDRNITPGNPKETSLGHDV